MNVTVERDDFICILRRSVNFISIRNPLIRDLLSLTIERGKVTVYASNIEGYYSESISATTIADNNKEIGSETFVVNGKKLFDVVKNLPRGDNVTIGYKETAFSVSSGVYRFSFPTMDKDQYPVMPDSIGGEPLAVVNRSDLITGLDAVKHAISNDMLRPLLNSVFIEGVKNAITLYASDGHRLAKITIKASCEKDWDFILDGRNSVLVSRTLKETVGDVVVFKDKNQIIFKTPSVTIGSHQKEGTIPLYANALPDSCSGEACINKDEAIAALHAIGVMTSKSGGITLSFTNGKLKFKCDTSDIGSAKTERDAAYTGKTEIDAVYTGEDFHIGANSHYMIDAIKSFRGRSVSISFDSNTSPFLFQHDEDIDEGLSCVVMPMRI